MSFLKIRSRGGAHVLPLVVCIRPVLVAAGLQSCRYVRAVSSLSYAAHWNWSAWTTVNQYGNLTLNYGWMRSFGIMDWAGGLAIHLSPGVSSFVVRLTYFWVSSLTFRLVSWWVSVISPPSGAERSSSSTLATWSWVFWANASTGFTPRWCDALVWLVWFQWRRALCGERVCWHCHHQHADLDSRRLHDVRFPGLAHQGQAHRGMRR